MMNFEFYVLNYDHNTNKVIMFNIFDNIRVQEEVEKEVRKYLRSSKKYHSALHRDTVLYGFEGFCYELERIIMWQEWSRCEYEIAVGGLRSHDIKDLEKWDCYAQAKPNIPVIAREVIYQAKMQLKEERNRKE